MAKKIKVGECKPGNFYIISGRKTLFFCLSASEEKELANFQEVGSDFHLTILYEKVKPVNIFMFSK